MSRYAANTNVQAEKTQQDYTGMNVRDLRALVRDRDLASGAAVVSARKSDLISLLTGEIDSLESPKTDLADVIAQALQGKIGGGLDETRVIELIKKHAKIEKSVKMIHLPDKRALEIEEHTHHCFEQALKLASVGLPVYLVGPAGTGKTTLAGQVAKALARRFSYNSLSTGCSESHLLGRTLPDADGNWIYKPSPFVTTFGQGGVHLFDEIDAADPNLMVIINSALANSHLSLPFEDRVIEKHPDTVIIAAANTYGNGANRQYVGRNALDAATLDRFTMSTVEVGYDEMLERSLANGILSDSTKIDDLLAWVKRTRSAIADNKLRRIMSTRTLVNAAMRIAAGDTLKTIRNDYLVSWTDDEKARLPK